MTSSELSRKKQSQPSLAKREVTVMHPDAEVLLSFVTMQPGCEWQLLKRVAEATVLGHDVDPSVQKIANSLIAVAIFEEKLPERLAGRPVGSIDHLKHVERAYRYYEALDSGKSDAVHKLANELCVGVRQLQREAQNYRWDIGGRDPDSRAQFRLWRSTLSDQEYQKAILEDLHFRLGARPGKPTQSSLKTVTKSVKEPLEEAKKLVKSIRRDLIDELTEQHVGPQTDIPDEPYDALD